MSVKYSQIKHSRASLFSSDDINFSRDACMGDCKHKEHNLYEYSEFCFYSSVNLLYYFSRNFMLCLHFYSHSHLLLGVEHDNGYWMTATYPGPFDHVSMLSPRPAVAACTPINIMSCNVTYTVLTGNTTGRGQCLQCTNFCTCISRQQYQHNTIRLFYWK
jgi:hypothetical protein